jgi:hypothetical protein
MKPHGSIRVVRIWCGIYINPVVRCFDNPEELCCGDLLVVMVPVDTNFDQLKLRIQNTSKS